MGELSDMDIDQIACKLLEEKGYAMYPLVLPVKNPMHFVHSIRGGRETIGLEYGIEYLLTPFIDRVDDPLAVGKAMTSETYDPRYVGVLQGSDVESVPIYTVMVDDQLNFGVYKFNQLYNKLRIPLEQMELAIIENLTPCKGSYSHLNA